MAQALFSVSDVIKVFGISAVAFIIAILWTPFLTKYLYKYKLWRKDVRQMAPDGSKTPLFAKLHKDRETTVPRLGGMLIWITTLAVALVIWIVAKNTDSNFWDKANFLSRNQTWLPLFTLVAASLLGLADDLFQVFRKGTYVAGGIKFRHRLFLVFLIALAGALWFYFKLDWRTLYVPGFGDVFIGLWYIPLFIATMIILFSSSVVDGIDGLAGGVFASTFAAYSGIAFFRGQFDIATFAAVILGTLLAFLWFNIPPARFYMGESGILGLTTSLTVIAFLTDSVFVLPIIGFVLMAEVASNVIQLASKRFRGKKVFLIAPIHHHFEAIGWPPHKVTMRFWIISVVAAIVGMVIALIGR
jgi:phospho-N-acetylmuramoyl-pentapeptide-transferase